jgi:hypothetical protein
VPSKVFLINIVWHYLDLSAPSVIRITGPLITSVQESLIIVVRAMSVEEKRIKKNHARQTGPKVAIRKKPHVTYVALKVCSPLKSQSFTLTET